MIYIYNLICHQSKRGCRAFKVSVAPALRQSYKLEACKFGYRASLDLNDNETAPRFAQLGLKSAMICLGLKEPLNATNVHMPYAT